MHTPDLRWALLAVSAAALLGACGSSDGNGRDSDTSSASDVPASALQSTDGLVAYLNELIGNTSETSQPVRLGEVVLPTTDTVEIN